MRQLPRRLDDAVLGLQHAADQVQQRGFADAVAADQPDLGAIRYLRVGVVEQAPLLDAVGYVGKGQHRGLITCRGPEPAS